MRGEEREPLSLSNDRDCSWGEFILESVCFFHLSALPLSSPRRAQASRTEQHYGIHWQYQRLASEVLRELDEFSRLAPISVTE
jgi:hypothetical protein